MLTPAKHKRLVSSLCLQNSLLLNQGIEQCALESYELVMLWKNAYNTVQPDKLPTNLG